MNAKDILARKFEKGFNGYKTDDVDEFIKELSEEFSNLQKENRDLEKKLEVLADRIREYRNDEDALKEALLGAQKQGQQAIADAKEKASNIVRDAESQSEVIRTAAEEKKRILNEEGEKLKSDAENEAERIVDEANKKSDKILTEMNYQIEINREILTRLKNEITDFSKRIISNYNAQMKRIEEIPRECENEYITKTIEEHKESQQKASKATNVNSSNVIGEGKAQDKDENELDIKKIYDSIDNENDEFEYDEGDQSYEVNELTFNKVFEEDDDAGDDAEEFDGKSGARNVNSSNNIFFKKSNPNSVKEPLDFGNRNKGKKN